jgi:hypothetical protein
MRIFARNPSLTDIEKTFLSDSTLVGATALLVKNTNNFVNGHRILIGAMSRERSELRTIGGAPTATGLTINAAVFPHDTDDPVYALLYDQVRIYRSTAGETGTFTLLTTIDIDVDNADGRTWYEDPNSTSSYWYKVSFYSSISAEETDQSAAVQSTGYSRDQIGSVILEVAKKVRDPDFIEMDPEEYIASANDTSTDLTTQAKRPFRFLKRNTPLNIGANSSTIDFPALFWKINFIEINDTSSAVTRVYRPKKVSTTQALANLASNTLGSDSVDGIAIDDEANQIIVYPKSLLARTGAVFFHDYKLFDDFTSFSSRIEGPTRLAYKLAMYRDYYLMKADSNNKYLAKATNYDNMYKVEVAKLQREKNIDAGGPQSMGAEKKRYPQFGGRRYRQ